MATISKNLERAIGRSINIPTGTDLVALLYSMGSEDRYYTPDITRLTNTNGLPVVTTWYNFTCDDIDPVNKRVYASHAQGYHYVATITNSGISKWSLEFSDNTYPVGIPIPFPGTTPPLGYALCNGQSFNLATYPKLATVYPTGVIPDLRGEFIRGWDNGRGVDSSRVILSAQQATGITDYHGDGGSSQPPRNYYENADAVNWAGSSFSAYGVNRSTDGASIMVKGITSYIKMRPRNVAYNYIVRMA
ncbi:tail fiber protein [Yersinia phage YerA41]|nr:tail fiber protein [Yersinia phage YerA41]